MPTHHFKLSPKKITLAILLVVFILALASVLTQLYRFLYLDPTIYRFDLFSLNEEWNIPTTIMSMLLFLNAIILFTISFIKFAENDKYRLNWGLLGFIFAYLAIDETAVLHEKLIHPFQDIFNTSGIFFYAWVIPGMALVLSFTLIYFKFWVSLPKKSMLFFAISAIIYVGGAIGMELIGGLYRETNGNQDLTFQILATIEEILEFLGVTCFIYTLLDYLKIKYQDVCIRFY